MYKVVSALKKGKKRRLLENQDEQSKKNEPVARSPSSGRKKSDAGRKQKSGSGSSNAPLEKEQKKRANKHISFPQKLMQLINDDTSPEYVHWIENEEAIAFKTEGFQENILDNYFQGLKYDSFIRKLNRWYGFCSFG
jgi:hypothetical protein